MNRLAGSRFMLVFLGLMVLVLSGCASTGTSHSEDRRPDNLSKAKKAYLKGVSEQEGRSKQLQKARRLARTYVKRIPDGQYAADAWLILAQVEFQYKRYKNVLSAVENGLEQTDAADIRGDLLMLKGRVSQILGNSQEALRAYQSAKELVDEQSAGADRINEAELEYRRASMLVQTGKFDRAERVFRSVINEFPDTNYAQKSRSRIRFMTDYFSVQLGLFRQESNALSFKRDLERQGRDPYVISTHTRNGTMYSVRLGKFQQFEQAKELAARLKEQGHDVIVKP